MNKKMSVSDSLYNEELLADDVRPVSEHKVDLHVYIVPPELWREHLQSAVNQVINDTVSAGFIRVMPESTVQSLREEIETQIGFELVPREFFFLKCVGRCFTRIKPKQERLLKVKNFIPPQAYAPELFILENTPDIQAIPYSGSTSAQSQTSRQSGYHSPDRKIPPGRIPPIRSNTISVQTGKDYFPEKTTNSFEDLERHKRMGSDTSSHWSSSESLNTKDPNSKSTQTRLVANADRDVRKDAFQSHPAGGRLLEDDSDQVKGYHPPLSATPTNSQTIQEEEMHEQKERMRKQKEELKRKAQEAERLEKERLKQEAMERRRHEEEQKRKMEEQERLQEQEEIEKRKQREEQKRLEEERHRKLEEKRLEEEKRKKEQAEKKREEEERRKRKEEEDKRKRKEEEEKRKREEEELRKELERKQKEEQRQKEAEQKRQEQQRKMEEEKQKKKMLEQLKINEKANLVKEIEELKAARLAKEQKREELLRKTKQMQTKNPVKKHSVRDNWKKKYFEEKKKTAPLDEHCNRLKRHLDSTHKRILANLESVVPPPVNIEPDKLGKANNNILHVRARQLEHDIEETQQRLEGIKMKLTGEMKLRNQAEKDMRVLRAELAQRKLQRNPPDTYRQTRKM